MVVGSLVVHRQTQHVVDMLRRNQWETPLPDGDPQTYWMSFPTATGLWEFPVEGCRWRAETMKAMGVHFLHRHVWDTILILEEGNPPHPRCPRCEIMVP